MRIDSQSHLDQICGDDWLSQPHSYDITSAQTGDGAVILNFRVNEAGASQVRQVLIDDIVLRRTLP